MKTWHSNICKDIKTLCNVKGLISRPITELNFLVLDIQLVDLSTD